MKRIIAWLLSQLRQLRRPPLLGDQGERIAERFLRRQGYRVVGRSVRSEWGEIDLIAVHQRTIVFVEVKTRRSLGSGHPAEAVDDEKQRRLTRLALVWLKRNKLLEYRSRFDVVAVTINGPCGTERIEHIQNAFPSYGRWQMFS